MTRKYFLIFNILSIVFLSNCSFDSKTGIWSGSEKEKERISQIEKEQKQVINTVKLYSSENIFLKEINSNKKIILTEVEKNNSWKIIHIHLSKIKD